MITWIERQATLQGRATRLTFATTMFVTAFILIVITLISMGNRLGYVSSWIISSIDYFLIWTAIAAQVRRLNDISPKANWLWLVWFVPGADEIAIFIFGLWGSVLFFMKPDIFNIANNYPDPRAGKR